MYYNFVPKTKYSRWKNWPYLTPLFLFFFLNYIATIKCSEICLRFRKAVLLLFFIVLILFVFDLLFFKFFMTLDFIEFVLYIFCYGLCFICIV